MKKKSLLFFLMLMPFLANASPVEINGIYYNLILKANNRIAEVTNSATTDKYSGDIIIPKSVEYNNITYSVTSIGNDAFLNCSNLTTVSIPNSITFIGKAAFNSSGLTSVTIPNSVISIGEGAFQNCSNLTSATISNGITSISMSTFSGCSNLISVFIPNSVTFIDMYAFMGCSNLTSVSIPNSVNYINQYAFAHCI